MSEYEICMQRGHTPRPRESLMGDSDGKGAWATCRWCGIQFRFVTTLEEQDWYGAVERGPEPKVEATKP